MDMLPSGNQLVKADEYYCLVLDDEGGWEPAVVDFKVTADESVQALEDTDRYEQSEEPEDRNQMQIVPIFSTVWKLTTVDETNKRNETYCQLFAVSKVRAIGTEDRNLYQRS